MAKLDFPNFQKYLSSFEFSKLFVEVLGWNVAPAEKTWQVDQAGGANFSRRTVAELGGVVVIQIVIDSGWPDEAQRMRVWKHIAHSHAENLLIFTDRQSGASQSQWYWVKRDKHTETGKPRLTARRHEYFVGQPVDLFASKLQAMVVELSELDTAGRLPVLEAARRIQAALDVEKTTKKFFSAYQQQHLELLAHIQGIDNERDKRWYASVLLNRLMFVWFLQKKGFLDQANYDYLSAKLQVSQAGGKDRFFGEFLNALFFEAFAKPETDRSKEAQSLTGKIPYLNGGLFLHHKLELDADHAPRVGKTLTVADAAFEGIFNLFASFTWHLDDTPGGDSDEINPDVLGYIFEKYINQKAFGAYYTRPEITGYLAERSIHHLILERVYEPAVPELKLKEIKFDTVADLLAGMDTRTALKLVNEVLPSITILDPAVGSGAFLVAALKTLINIYYAVVGRAELGASAELQNWLRAIQKDHPSVGYYIKRRIVTDNLHGVDIMDEACEIAKLRLFLAMVSSVRKVEDLEPLPNIDFNILPGNSLVGLMRVDEHEFDAKYRIGDMFRKSFRELVDEKNRRLQAYRHAAEIVGKNINLRVLRDDIDNAMHEANSILNEIVQDKFDGQGIKFEEAQWDTKNKALGKSKKRQVTLVDIEAETPFHWGYVFDDIINKRGGFDIVLANPPWEAFKPFAREFFSLHSKYVTKKKMDDKAFEALKDELFQTGEIRDAWLEYESRFPHMSAYYRSSPDFINQVAVVEGKKTGSDLDLYKLFVERIFNLLRPGGHSGIVIPAGIYMALGATGLRNLLFAKAKIGGIAGFVNSKEIFEDVHRSYKFVVLTFEKCIESRLLESGETNASAPPNDLLAPQATLPMGTAKFPAVFMLDDPAALAQFPDESAIWFEVDLIRRMSPESHSMMEFKSDRDLAVVEKLLKFPLLGEEVKGAWNLTLMSEFHMTIDKKLFKPAPSQTRLPLFEGKMMWQFECQYAEPTRWVEELEGRQASIGKKGTDKGQELSYQRHRLCFRSAGENTNERNLISTILPKRVFCGNSLTLDRDFSGSHSDMLYICAMFNSFVLDWLLRLKIQRNLNMFLIYQLPMPRLNASDLMLRSISYRTARLICTTPEFDDLAQAVGLKSHREGAVDPTERARLRAELDGLVAHLYGLTEAEFVYILGTFPLVPQPVKVAAHNAYRDVERGLIT